MPKEDLILQDDVDTQVIEAFEGQPAGLRPVAAFRAALREVILSTTLPAEGWPGEDQSIIAMFVRIDEALSLLEAGLPL